MAFKVRDLMIDVAPAARVAGYCLGCTQLMSFPTPWCRPYSWYYPTIVQCPTATITLCPGGSIQCTITDWNTTPQITTTIYQTQTIEQIPGLQTPAFNQPGMIASPQNLTELKAQLRQALAQVEAQERAAAESMRPQSLEEVDMLEQKLTEALEELRQHKDELRRRASE